MAYASVLGGFLGLERRIQAQPAGMRTQMVISAASCLAMEVSRHLPHLEGSGDPDRIAQSVLQGIGFVGAGAILKSGLSFHGLTTAATIWAAATIGLASGAGFLIQAAALAILVSGGLLALEPLELALTRRREMRRIILESREVPDLLAAVRPHLEKHAIRLDEVAFSHRLEDHRMTLTLTTACPEKMSVADLVRDLATISGTLEIRIE